jgi:hypothetical protein
LKVHELIEASYPTELNRTNTVSDQQPVSPGPGYSIAYDAAFKLYRGNKYRVGSKFMTGNSLKTNRASRNTDNFYTELLSNVLPSWKDWPRRDQCFVCTTSPATAVDFGRGLGGFRVYPKGDPIIGICPTFDFWQGFRGYGGEVLFTLRSSLHLFNNSFLQLSIDLASLTNDRKINPDISLTETLKKIDVLWAKKDSTLFRCLVSRNFIDQFSGNKVKEYFKKYPTFTAMLNDAFDPVKNGFQKGNLSSLPYVHENHEVWFCGEAFFVSCDSVGNPKLDAVKQNEDQ